MGKYRHKLPQLSNDIYLTDGGLETSLIFLNGYDLPEFAAFEVFNKQGGQKVIYDYFASYAEFARENNLGFILESYTWRASSKWGKRLGYSEAALQNINHKAIEFLEYVRGKFETKDSLMPISGCIGPYGDGYNVDDILTADQAQQYHRDQIKTFYDSQADFVSAFTMTYIEEAVGIVLAAKSFKIPVVISFTTETNGKLPSGTSLKDAVETVDSLTDNYPVYYMINCSHPTHFKDVLAQGGGWLKRIRGIRANASKKSHSELDKCTSLDHGILKDFGEQYRDLLRILPNLNILGGCCGTDIRHIQEIFDKCISGSIVADSMA